MFEGQNVQQYDHIDVFSFVLVSPKGLLQRPKAGSTVPHCPIEKRIPDCWSPIEPSTFKVRGKNYFRWECLLPFCILIIHLICSDHKVIGQMEHFDVIAWFCFCTNSWFGCRDKKKDFAPTCAAFYPFGVDVFVCPRKIHHIARFVELPSQHVSGDAPSILVVNVQVYIAGWTMLQSYPDVGCFLYISMKPYSFF